MSFVDDLSTSNSENLKGLIRLDNNQLELALGHFQLALKKKRHNFTASASSLGLAWVLEQWDFGLDLIKEPHGRGGLSVLEKKALRASLSGKLQRYQEMKKIVLSLESQYPQTKKMIVQLLRGLTGVITDNPSPT